MASTSLYVPYKAVGYVTGNNPFVINRLGNETFLTTTIGKSFQVYRIDRLTICLVSRLAKSDISSIQVGGHETFAAVGNDILVYNRTQIVRTYHEHKSHILGLNIVGKILLSYDIDNKIKIIDIKERKVIAEITTLQNSKIICTCHPSTYVNKFILGYENGQLELWNVRSKKIIYIFESHISYLKKKRKINNSLYGDGILDDYADSDDDVSFICPSVTCLEQTPACDVIAVGFTSGDILLINMKLDSVLFSFKQEGGAVTSISFRTDAASEKFPFMVSGSPDGRLHIWNLGTNSSSSSMYEEEEKLERRLERTIKDAHMGSVTRVHFLYGEPVMISAAADNTIKVWIFDAPDGSVRLLRSREGHSGCPLRIRYYGGGINVSIRDNAEATSCEIISAGSDGTLRLFNTAIESQNREMSQNPILKKLGMHRRNARLPITTGFDFCETRQKDWGNLVSIHKNHTNAYLWRFKHRVVTEVILRQPSWQNNEMMYSSDRTTHSTAVALSPCGNYAIVGSRGGVIYKYNVQSGTNRGAYPIKFAELSMKKGTEHTRLNTIGNVLHEHKQIMNDDGRDYSAGSLKGGNKKNKEVEKVEIKIVNEGHTQEITGIYIDMMNATMVSCGLDGLVIFWDFNNHNELNRIAHKSPQLFMQGFRDSNFIALAGQDRIVRLYDISTHKLSRRFDGHSREITDISFTPDGRRLLTSSVDCTVRVWDIVTGRCLSWHLFPDAVLTMTVSPSGEYLCIAQADKEGIYMYVDRSLYETVHFWKEPTSPTPIADSLTLIEGNDDNLDIDNNIEDDENNNDSDSDDVLVPVDIVPVQAQIESGVEKESSEQRGEGSITMSAVPKAYWTTLFNLEAIKSRNKAKAAPVAPKQAPFFLTTIVKGGATPSFPTPTEYKAILEKNLSSSLMNAIGDSSDDPFPSKRNIDIDVNNNIKKIKVSNDDVSAGNDEAKILAELASMGSAWGSNDDWGDNDDKDIDININSRSANVSDEINHENFIENDIKSHVRTTNKAGSNSRIIGKNTKFSRCNLIMYLLEEYPNGLKSKKTQINDNNIDLTLMKYLKTLPPPAVDLEIRAICGYEGDDEGIMLLRCFISWLTENLKKGTNFEVLQAYIHRTVLIYSELFTKIPNISCELDILKDVHRDISDRFRHLVQSNLCLLKMLAGLSST